MKTTPEGSPRVGSYATRMSATCPWPPRSVSYVARMEPTGERAPAASDGSVSDAGRMTTRRSQKHRDDDDRAPVWRHARAKQLERPTSGDWEGWGKLIGRLAQERPRRPGLPEEQDQRTRVAVPKLELETSLERLGVARPRFSLDTDDPTRTSDCRVPRPLISGYGHRDLGRPAERWMQPPVKRPEKGHVAGIADRRAAGIQPDADVQPDDRTATDQGHQRHPRRPVPLDPAPFGVGDAGRGRRGIDAEPAIKTAVTELATDPNERGIGGSVGTVDRSLAGHVIRMDRPASLRLTPRWRRGDVRRGRVGG